MTMGINMVFWRWLTVSNSSRAFKWMHGKTVTRRVASPRILLIRCLMIKRYLFISSRCLSTSVSQIIPLSGYRSSCEESVLITWFNITVPATDYVLWVVTVVTKTNTLVSWWQHVIGVIIRNCETTGVWSITPFWVSPDVGQTVRILRYYG